MKEEWVRKRNGYERGMGTKEDLKDKRVEESTKGRG